MNRELVTFKDGTQHIKVTDKNGKFVKWEKQNKKKAKKKQSKPTYNKGYLDLSKHNSIKLRG